MDSPAHTAAFSRKEIGLSNWRTFPYCTWTFQNVSEFVPSAEIASSGHDEPAVQGTAEVLTDLQLAGRQGTTTLLQHLEDSHADSFVLMRDGEVLVEWHAAHVEPSRPHLVFSISKSITGILAGIAIGDGLLDPDAPVSRYVEVRSGAYADATVRHLLDMTVALDFEEDYLDRNGAFDRYRRAMLWNPERPDTGPEALEDVLVSLPRSAGRHGELFFYASPNTDMLGLVIERATGIRYHRYLAERLWQPMGAKGSAQVTVDRAGTARAAGGISVTARDLARLGQLVLDSGRTADGRQVVPQDWIDDMRRNGDRQAWLGGSFLATFPEGRYRSSWYQAGDDHDCFAADGIHGQRLWVDPVTRIVAVKFSSQPNPADDEATIRDFSIMAQVARAF